MNLPVRLLPAQRALIILSLLFCTIGCDQVTKRIAVSVLKNMDPLTYFNNLIRFEYAENRGAFLSLGANLPYSIRFWFFTIAVAIALILFAFHLLSTKRDLLSTTGTTLILGGGIGNLIDRMFLGHVVDFLNFGIGNLRTGIFNVADMAIMLGVSLLLLKMTPATKRTIS